MTDDMLDILQTEGRLTIERWVRQRVQASVDLNQGTLCRVLGKYRMLCDRDDLSLTPCLALDGLWEVWVTMCIAQRVKPGMRCIDIGANVGYYTLLLADLVGPAGHVIAYEPDAALFELLDHNACINGFEDRVVARRVAVSDHYHECLLQRDFDYHGNNRLVEAATADECVPVECAALDGEELGLVDFIKIDAEGQEAKIWKGMTTLLMQQSPKICMEYTPRDSGVQLIADIEAAGYQIGVIQDDGTVRSVAADQFFATIQGADFSTFSMLWLERK